MNDNRMKRWMDAIDDDLLGEAQRPLPRGGAARRWGALAACFCAAALALALWQPWSAGIGDNTAGADADFGAMDKSFSVAMPPVLDAEPLSASLALPEGADVLGYDLFDLNGETVTEVSFTLNSVTWHYRMAPTLDVSETTPDISGFTGGSLTAEGKLRWCPTVLRWDAGGAGCIIWRDLAPGLAYSLTADTGASEDALSDMAALVFKPAQEES